MSIDRLHHFEFPRVDVECICQLCTDWRDKRCEYEQLRRFVHHHSRSCSCWKCCRCRELQIEYLASQNKRDVYCELSWHASKEKGGLTFMKWLEQELLTSEESTGWWAKLSPCFSLNHWVYQFKVAVTNNASGAVTTTLAISGIAA